MYRKFSADHIFTGHEILQQHVLITDSKGLIADVVHEKDAGDGVKELTGLLSPGFINCHCHLELSHMKGRIPRHAGLVDFILRVINERHDEELDILTTAIGEAENEMHRNGIVAVGDICNNILTIPQKLKGRLHYHNFIEASGFPPAVAELRFNRAADLYHSYSISQSANSIVPHAPYSVSEKMFSMICQFAGNNLLSIHNQESPAENELFEKGSGDLLMLYKKMGIDISFFKPSGKSSLRTVLPYFDQSKSLILVHNVCTTEKDIESVRLQFQNLPARHTGLKPENVFFCLCPNANLYIGNQLPDIKLLMEQGVDLVLGTDSLASNDALSILEEMKTIQKNFPVIELAELLKWATVNGAKALRMNSTLGDFEKGKRPGVVLIEGINGPCLTDRSSSRRIL